MQYRMLGAIGKSVSAIAMGSTSFGTDLDSELTADILDAYCAVGGNFIDTARVYGDFDRGIVGISEETIGRWLKRQDREKLVIGTKGGHHPLIGPMVKRLDALSLKDDLKASLDALGTDYVDLYWLHRDDESREVAGIMDTLNGFLADKRVRAIGASNWSPARIREANAYADAHGLTGFCANQPQWSLAKMGVQEDPTLYQMDADTYRLHIEKNLICVPYSSQAKGFFSKLFAGGEASLSEKARRRFLTAANLRVYEALKRIQAATGASVGALALAFLTCQPFPVYPIVGVSRLEQVCALREAGDTKLTEAHMAELMELAAPV